MLSHMGLFQIHWYLSNLIFCVIMTDDTISRLAVFHWILFQTLLSVSEYHLKWCHKEILPTRCHEWLATKSQALPQVLLLNSISYSAEQLVIFLWSSEEASNRKMSPYHLLVLLVLSFSILRQKLLISPNVSFILTCMNSISPVFTFFFISFVKSHISVVSL